MKYRLRLWLCFFGFMLFVLAAMCGFIYSTCHDISNKIDAQTEKLTIEVEVVNPTPDVYKLPPRNLDVTYVDLMPADVEPEKIEFEYYDSPIHLSEDDRWVVESVVAGEAGGEPYEGKKAVAQCIFNAMLKNSWTARQVRDNYGYDGWNPNLDEQDRAAYMDVVDAVSDVFDRGQLVTEKPILFFYAPRWCTSEWHESQEFEMEIGGHRFFYLAEDENAEWTNILLTNVDEYGIIEP